MKISEDLADKNKANSIITREEMAELLIRVCENNGLFVNLDYLDSYRIPDYEKISDVYKDSVEKAYFLKLLVGVNEFGDFAPKNSLNRAEGAVVIQRLINKFG